MIYTNIPEKARERKTIVFMEDYQLEIAKLDKNNKWLEDPNVCVLEYPDNDIPEDYPVLTNDIYLKLKDKGLITQNEHCVLVQYPYDTNDYTKPIDSNLIDFIYTNAIEKYNIFSELCACLGATRVVYQSDKKESESYSEQTNLNLSGGGGNKIISGNLNVDINRDLNRKLKESLSVDAEAKFKGSDKQDKKKQNNFWKTETSQMTLTFSH